MLEGPIDSQIVSMSYSYWMSPKWITTAGVTIDMKNLENLAPAFQLIRVGESLLGLAEHELRPGAEHGRRGDWGGTAIPA